MSQASVHGLYRALISGQLSRRDFLARASALGITATAAGLMLRAAETRAQDAPSAPPVVAEGDGTMFAGQEITIQVIDASVKLPLDEVRDEYEAATGAKLNIVADPIETAFSKLLEDAATGTNSIDGSVIGMWWLGDLVAGNFVRSYDDYYDDTSAGFPQFDFEDELPGMRALRMYGGQKYVIPYDADGQTLYYRRDLLTDADHMAAYKEKTGNDLNVPQTWDELYAIASYFKDTGIDGISMHLKVGGQGMFHYMSLSGPYIIGPENPTLYWFDPETMDPLVESAGHVEAANMIKQLFDLGPEAQAGWALGEAWDHFLQGNAVFTFSWGDVLPLAVEQDAPINGNVGTAQLPGTLKYTNPLTGESFETEAPNLVGNTTGGSWSGVIMSGSESPEAVYYLFALLATKAKQQFFATRGSDGVDPGRMSQMPPEAVEGGTGSLEEYVAQGFSEADAIEYTRAYYDTFQNPNQLPYLRIPGTAEYWNALDIRLSEFVTGQVGSAEEAMATLAQDFRDINDRLGVDLQLEIYKDSLGL